MEGGGQIVLYQPDENVKLEVKVDAEHNTVWLTQQQIADLFGKKQPAISKHIKNIYESGELQQEGTYSILEYMGNEGKQSYTVKYYNLDMILSIGYRCSGRNATLFRQWASSVLREYLLKGYALQPTLKQVEYHLSKQISIQGEKLQELQEKVQKHDQQLDFFIRTNTPPAEMVFYNGEFFTARVAIENLIKTAKRRVVIIDHYVDAKTFDMFDVRGDGVQGIIYTQGVGAGMTRLRQEHDSQPNAQPVEVRKWRLEPHDRWLIIDDLLYHCGHSLNATGRKLSAITLMGTSPEDILSQME